MKLVYSVSKQVTVKNENGTSSRSACGCGSWIAHWEKISGQSAGLCVIEGCQKKGTEGAHTTRPLAENDDYKTHSYIVPMCSMHNGKHGESFKTKNAVTFVWANVKGTCGK